MKIEPLDRLNLMFDGGRYQLIELPKVSVAERCTFVLQALAISDA